MCELRQVFTADVGFDEEKKETELKEAQAFECTGVVSLVTYYFCEIGMNLLVEFNYHLCNIFSQISLI